jgi:hypothetical protein
VANYYVHAEFENMEAITDAIGPFLQLDCRVTLSQSGSGSTIDIADGVSQLSILDVQGRLFWTIKGEQAASTMLLLGSGASHGWYYGRSLSTRGDAERIQLAFPIRPDQLMKIEELRAGGKSRFSAFIRLICDSPLPMAAVGLPPTKGPPTFEEFKKAMVPIAQHRMIVTDNVMVTQRGHQELEVEKSKWVEEILPGLGWGSWRIFEVPISNTQDNLSDIDSLIVDAQRQFNLGNWPASLTASRRTVEALKPLFQEKVNPAHSDEKGGDASAKASNLSEDFEELSKAMLKYQASVRSLMAAGAHKPSTGATLERADAELGLMLAIGLRRYVGLRMMKQPD